MNVNLIDDLKYGTWIHDLGGKMELGVFDWKKQKCTHVMIYNKYSQENTHIFYLLEGEQMGDTNNHTKWIDMDMDNKGEVGSRKEAPWKKLEEERILIFVSKKHNKKREHLWSWYSLLRLWEWNFPYFVFEVVGWCG